LGDEFGDDVVEQVEVVVVRLAQFEKVERQDGTEGSFEIDLDPIDAREVSFDWSRG
jgi:hypothetical protein